MADVALPVMYFARYYGTITYYYYYFNKEICCGSILHNDVVKLPLHHYLTPHRHASMIYAIGYQLRSAFLSGAVI
jgi:hypothetical protein